MSTWTINGQSPETLGLTVVGGQFNSGRASTVQLVASIAFDAAEVFNYDQSVTILRDGTPFFRGKVREIPKSGSSDSEDQLYIVEDAWAELERLTYQEPWGIREGALSGAAYSPTVILGINSLGNKISLGQQITEVLDFAISQGVSLLAGNIPAGMMMWPTEVNGMSCASVIRESLKYHVDWIPWLDHSTNPPTFQVTPRSEATAITVPVTDTENLSVTKTEDRIPEAVKIVYLTATLVDGQVYRAMAIDQFPNVSNEMKRAPAGPGVLVTTVELAGMQMQIQKQQVKVRPLPLTQENARAYLKKKFPVIKDIPDDKFAITAWSTAVIPEVDDEADPVDDKLERLPASVRSELPNELLKGSIAEWMQKKVGKVLIEMKVKPSAGATADQKKKLALLPDHFHVLATDAVTKIYRGVSSYTAGEQIPQGIAQAYYQTILASCLFSGSFTLNGHELPNVGPMHGAKVNLSGCANAEWGTMAAPVHSISWDLRTCRATIGFGPNPELSFQDFLEFLRLLSKRDHRNYTFAERSGNQLGDAGGISAKGDSVGPYDTPETTIYPLTGSSAPAPFSLRTHKVENGTISIEINFGIIREIVTKGGTDGVIYHQVEVEEGVTLATDPPPEIEISAGQTVHVRYETDDSGGIKSDPKPSLVVLSGEQTSTHYQPPNPGSAGTDGIYLVKIGKLVSATEDEIDWEQFQNSDIEHYHELWKGVNVGIGAEVFKRRNAGTDAYEFRKIQGKFGVNETQSSATIQIDLDAENLGDGVAIFRAPDSEEDLPNGPAQFHSIRGISSSEAAEEDGDFSPQISVDLVESEDGEDADTIRVRGNGNMSTIRFEDDGETPALLGTIQVQDGLVTTPGTTITIPAGSLEDGTIAGQLLVWDGTAWALLDPPTGESSDNFFLACAPGGSPSWKLVGKETIDICDSGSPSTIDVYIDPA